MLLEGLCVAPAAQLPEKCLIGRKLLITSVFLYCLLLSFPLPPPLNPLLSPLSNDLTALKDFLQFYYEQQDLAGYSSVLHCLLHLDARHDMKTSSRFRHTEGAGTRMAE